jgi:superfamily II DNA helicase RecQ
MKKCTKCKNDCLIENFPIINKKTNKRSSMCTECKREYDREYYELNKAKNNKNKNELARINRNTKRTYIIDVLKKSSCCDCGNNDWRVLEFDHRDRDLKEFSIADSTGLSIKKIQLEIDKCDIVCANCHNIRTIEQRGYYNFE